MKITDFKGVEAVDVLADIMMPVANIVSDEDFKAYIGAGDKTGMQIAVYILKNHQNDVLDMYEPLMKESKEEATPTKLIRLVLDIASDPDISSLFIMQGQSEALTPSGSATENTEDGLR